ncbi:MAG: embR 1 [Ilumatobacteraceae bacterium]|nr:embR 1 [Ilumatobacteraceae bacterium]
MGDELRFQLMGGLAAWRTAAAGPVELELGGPQPRRLLAALLLSLGQPLPPDRLIELVWGDGAPASARGSLQASISNLRRVLEPARPPARSPQVLVLRPGGYQLLVERSQVDVGRFEAEVTSAAADAAAGRPAAVVRRLEGAVDTGSVLLPELAEAAFVIAEAARLDARRATAFELLQTGRLALGRHHEAIADLRRRVALIPRAERLWALLAVARYRAGEPAEAIATIHAARSALADAGLSLGPELRQLESDLFAQAPTLGIGLGPLLPLPPLDLEPAAPTGGVAVAATRPVARRCVGSRRPHAFGGGRHHGS